MSDQIAILLGASGSVGQALLIEIVKQPSFKQVIVLCRTPLSPPPPFASKIVTRVVAEMTPANLAQAVIASLASCDLPVTAFSTLGIGAGTAKLSLEEHRAVDVALNGAFASGLKTSGKVGHLIFMSAIGANIMASTTGSGAAGMPRYARVKGEAEHAVLNQGPPLVSIFRPAVIIGSKHTPGYIAALLKAISALLPYQYRAVKTTEIAQAMVALSIKPPQENSIYTYADMKARRHT
ncbi:hypothetical protein [Parvibium lacunae]|uniref:NAD(P)-binding domain-containing protein n=1 Tax=Parvibium lacunae TaxID=1888893 RepID=A0A368L0W1_9BURK|nr:hypothetical protein [Parvibium lacunae]RCS57037.1 hypothetical protein DU000_09525 [Parvibium lacunae]